MEGMDRATTVRNKIEESNTEMIGIFTQQKYSVGDEKTGGG